MPPVQFDDLLRQFGLTELHGQEDLIDQAMAYVVAQGTDLITIGSSGSSGRLRALMGGSAVHNKKPLISLCRKVRPTTPIRFAFTVSDSAESAERIERKIQQVLGSECGRSLEATRINNHYGYRNALGYLLDLVALDRNERHLDLIALVRADGDILQHALGCDRLRQIAIDVFGDTFASDVQRTKISDNGIGILHHVPTGTPGWYFVRRTAFVLKGSDLQSVTNDGMLGLEIFIDGTGARWQDGPGLLRVPNRTDDPYWAELVRLSKLPAFQNHGQYSNSQQVPLALRGCFKKQEKKQAA